jgi:hypothetical protein
MTAKRRARAFYSLLSVLALGVLVAGCPETRGALGADCLKNDDCLSNICESLHCTAAAPICDVDTGEGCPDAGQNVTDAGDGGEGGEGGEAGGDAAVSDAPGGG